MWSVWYAMFPLQQTSWYYPGTLALKLRVSLLTLGLLIFSKISAACQMWNAIAAMTDQTSYTQSLELFSFFVTRILFTFKKFHVGCSFGTLEKPLSIHSAHRTKPSVMKLQIIESNELSMDLSHSWLIKITTFPNLFFTPLPIQIILFQPLFRKTPGLFQLWN